MRRVVVQVCAHQERPAGLGPSPAVSLCLESERIFGRVVAAKGIEADAGHVAVHSRGGSSLARLRGVLAGDGRGGCAGDASARASGSVLCWLVVGEVRSDLGIGQGVAHGKGVGIVEVANLWRGDDHGGSKVR